jgi:putative Mn2+ efflux pump MntP
MKTLIVLGFLTGLDNLQITPGLGLMGMPAARRWLLAFTFGLCEAGMPLLGLGIGRLLHRSFDINANKLGPALLLFCGALIIWLACREKDVAPLMASRWTLFGLPLLLSLDNLLVGIGIGATGQPFLLAALVLGLISTVMCFIGLYLGNSLRRYIPEKAELLAGAYLFVLGLAQLPGGTFG